MKIRLVFEDWQQWDAEKKRTASVYGTQRGLELSRGDLHSGSIFDGTIEVDADDAELLIAALQENIRPVFSAIYPKAEAPAEAAVPADNQQPTTMKRCKTCEWFQDIDDSLYGLCMYRPPKKESGARAHTFTGERCQKWTVKA